jgi:serine/threonine protein kinase
MGRYKVVRELGRNREAGRITSLATDTSLDPPQQVVIKEFRFAASGANWSGFKAYQREIEVLRQLEHPRIPRYLDSFETKTGFCLVQEYKNALSLAVRRSFEPEDIKKIAVSVLEILVYLQKRTPPVIHRDIKPENILVDEQLNACLVDFGFARIRGGELAVSSVAAGTPGFMPPEEQFGRPLTQASDLYSLGATLICLLTGTRSVDVGNLIDDNYRFDFKKLVPQLSPRFMAWLERMVAPNVKQRFNNAAAALEALKPIDVFDSPNTKQQLVKSLSAVTLAIAAIGSVAVMNSVNQPSSPPLGSSPFVEHLPPTDSVHSPVVQHSPQINLVTNGDFEVPYAGSDFIYYAKDYAKEPFPGWRVEDIDHVGAWWQAASGKQSIDLSGSDAGTIYQDLATNSRQTYTLRFALAGNALPGNSQSRVKQIEVWWGSALVDTLSFDTTPHSYSSMGWKYYEYKVVAPMGVNTTRLKFVSLTPGNSGPALDDVTVTP